MKRSSRILACAAGAAAAALLLACSAASTYDALYSGTEDAQVADAPGVDGPVFDGGADGKIIPPDAAGDAAIDAAADAIADAAPLDCSAAAKLRDYSADFFCPFTPVGSMFCGNGQTCCNPGKNAGGTFGASYCAPNATKTTTTGPAACVASNPGWIEDGGTTWQCADKNACGGKACCLFTRPGAPIPVNIGATPVSDPNVPVGCNALRAYQQGGTRCSTTASCAAGEIATCSLSDNACPAGTKCTPFDGFHRDLGYCK